jgi:hypothetical protein
MAPERITRRADTLLSGLATFLVGLLVGALGTYATLAGRVAAIETTIMVHSAALQQQGESLKAELTMLGDIRSQLAVLSAASAASEAARRGKGYP